MESAIRDAARHASTEDPSLTVDERIRHEYFRRFLSRIFSEGAESRWVLKGGVGMLARTATSRATLDIDLLREAVSLDDALEDLRRLAAVDLDDFFRFVVSGWTATVAGDQQAYTEGYRVTVDTYVGVQRKTSLRIDLVVGVVTTAAIETAPPADALALPKLRGTEYRLYPVVDQIADKVCATLALYSGSPSSREKDLVDLVVLAVTQDLDAVALRTALISQARVRGILLPSSFSVPSAWGDVYERMASKVPACRDHQTIASAVDLVTSVLNPVLTGAAVGRTWRGGTREWR